jgi:hypothetical protein
MTGWLPSVNDAIQAGENYLEASRRLCDNLDHSSLSERIYSRIDNSLTLLTALDLKLKAASSALRLISSVRATKGAIRSLPAEILQRIFTIGAKVRLTCPPTTPSALFTFPVLVSHVCRYWRDLSLHLPSIWSYLYFGPTKSQLLITKLLIDRTSTSPLHIFFQSPSELAFSLARRYYKRWSSVSISIIKGDPGYDASVHALLQKLELLPRNDLFQTLAVRRPGEHGYEDKYYSFFGTFLPRFQVIRLESSLGLFLPTDLPNIRVLRLKAYHIDPGGLLQILRSRAASIVELDLDVVDYEDDYPPEEDPIELRHLTLLHLSLMPNNGIVFCQRVIAPNLRTLAVTLEFPPFVDDLIHFTQHSPLLSSLEVWGICKHYQSIWLDVIKLLNNIHTLRNLRIIECRIDDHSFDAIDKYHFRLSELHLVNSYFYLSNILTLCGPPTTRLSVLSFAESSLLPYTLSPEEIMEEDKLLETRAEVVVGRIISQRDPKDEDILCRSHTTMFNYR